MDVFPLSVSADTVQYILYRRQLENWTLGKKDLKSYRFSGLKSLYCAYQYWTIWGRGLSDGA